jgi:hypothetical protein
MRRASRDAWLVSGWLAFVAVVGALVFISSAPPAHAAARRSCGASSSASSGASAQATKGSARISLNTAQGVAGTQVVVSGAGWPVGQQVFISVENLTDEQGGVNGTGRLVTANVNVYGGFTTPAFSFPYAVCGVRPKAGTTASIVAATNDNSVRVVRPFALAQTPTLAVVAPQQLSPFLLGVSGISVVGSDWAPGATVALVAAHLDTISEADGTQRQTATPLPGAQPVYATADARGDVTANVPIPSGLAPGTVVNLSATAISASYGTLLILLDPHLLVPAPVPPTWHLSASQGEPGMTLTVTGDHWWPADTIGVEYCRAEAAQPTTLGVRCNSGPQGFTPTGYAAQLGEAIVGASGHFTATVTLPANAKPGAIIVQARPLGGNGRAEVYFASRAFTVIQPAARVTPLPTLRRDWWPQALVGVLLIGSALFVFWPRFMRAIRRRSAPAASAHPTTTSLEGDDDDE